MGHQTFKSFMGRGKSLHSERGLSIQERLEARRLIDTTTGCWLWTGAKSLHGYGKMKIGGRNGYFVSTHRLAFEVYKGPITKQALHIKDCPNKCCFNPEHLYDGSQSENMRDRWAGHKL